MKNLFAIILFSITLGFYQVGDVITISDQNLALDVCYGDYPETELKLADFNGFLNGGHFQFIVFRFTASW